MTTILNEIVAARRRQLAECKTEWPLERLQESLQPSSHNFTAALRSPRPAFILECKQASPSRGLIREDLNVPEIAAAYGQFASAISVLTEPEYFQGSYEILAEVRQQVQQPILCKDFVVDPWQIVAARYFGADAVLLILAIIDDPMWREFSSLAHSLGMSTLTEISTPGEQRRAIELGAPVVGINNRNLRDMTIDLGRTRQLAAGLSPDTLIISESGYHSNQQVRQMSDVADGFLIGSSLMAQPDLLVAVKRMIFGDHKVCGLTFAGDATVADQCGAVYGGVIFADHSPRAVTTDRAAKVFEDCRLRRIGVFQDQTVDFVAAAVTDIGLNGVQLHGREETGYVSQLRGRIPESVEIWKALPVHQLDEREDYWSVGATRILVDQPSGSGGGGSGQPFDWTALPADDRHRLVIAGGLGPENVVPALQLECGGLDFNSRLETAPGKKSPDRIRQLFNLIRKY